MPNKRKYAWDEWLARRTFTLRRGVHYRCTQTTMAQQIRNAASERGVSVHIVETEKGFKVTVQPGKGDEPTPSTKCRDSP